MPTLVRQDGDKFWRMPETYVRGNTIKYLRVPNEVGASVQSESYELCIAHIAALRVWSSVSDNVASFTLFIVAGH